MNEINLARNGQHLLMVCSDEFKMLESVYEKYPEGYDKVLAAKNCRLFADVVPQEFPVASAAVARVLLDIGMAKAMAQAYYCAKSELGRGRGGRNAVRDAYVDISGLVKEWRELFSRMDPGVVGNEDLAEILRQIELDGNEEEEFEEFDNMSD